MVNGLEEGCNVLCTSFDAPVLSLKHHVSPSTSLAVKWAATSMFACTRDLTLVSAVSLLGPAATCFVMA